MQQERNLRNIAGKSFQDALLQSDLDVEEARQRAELAEMRLEDVRGNIFNPPSPWPAATSFFLAGQCAKGSKQ